MRRPIALAAVPFALVLGVATLVAAQDASPTATPAACATPAASPAATPDASPVASPVASPTASGCVAVSLYEWGIDMPDALAAGPTTFVVTNAGEAEHNFEIEGQGVEEELPRNLKPGETAELRIDLETGEYEVYCPVPGHKEAGMELELTVR